MTLQAYNASRWASAKLTRQAEYRVPVQRALAAKDRYLQIARRTGVHWVFIACTHYRESSFDFSRSLAQGDRWDHVYRNVPAGRGPFQSFEDAAVDALVNCAPYAAKNTNWSMPDLLTVLEAYNGLGYYHKGLPSPYIWSGTDQYSRGKYVRDGVFDPNVVDQQLGVAGLILCLWQADPSITFPADPDSPPVHNPLEPHTLPAQPKVPVILPAPHTPIANNPESRGIVPPPKAKEVGLAAVWEWLRNH